MLLYSFFSLRWAKVGKGDFDFPLLPPLDPP